MGINNFLYYCAVCTDGAGTGQGPVLALHEKGIPNGTDTKADAYGALEDKILPGHPLPAVPQQGGMQGGAQSDAVKLIPQLRAKRHHSQVQWFARHHTASRRIRPQVVPQESRRH